MSRSTTPIDPTRPLPPGAGPAVEADVPDLSQAEEVLLDEPLRKVGG